MWSFEPPKALFCHSIIRLEMVVFQIALTTKIGLSMIFPLLNDRGQEVGGLPFALLLVEANATIKFIKCMRFTYFYATFLKSVKSLFIGVLAIKEGNKCGANR